MFWALAQREKDRKRWREEALKEGRENERARIERELSKQGIELSPEILEIIRDPHSGNGSNPESP